MKVVRHGFKRVNITVLALAMGLFSSVAMAEPEYSDSDFILSTNNVSSSVVDNAASTYRPVAQVVPELAQIVFYYPQGNVPATINVDRELQSALLPGEFTVFCVAPGAHVIESYFSDQPLYQGKQNPARQINVSGSQTYFLQVNEGTAGTTTALAQRPAAENVLKTMRKHNRIINRASQVKPCEYVNGGGVILIQESVLFRFAKSGHDGILPKSITKLNDVVKFIKQSNVASEIQVVGYTDAIGNRESNQRLSEARANTVRTELIRAGINPDIITNASGMGVAHSAEGCGVGRRESGCNVNSRRVDIIVK